MEAKYLISVESKGFADVRPNIVLFGLPRFLITSLILFSSTILLGQSVEGRWTTYQRANRFTVICNRNCEIRKFY